MLLAGFTTGFEYVEEKPNGELVQAYELPGTAAPPMDIDFPGQMAVSEMTAAAGSALTLMVTALDLTHPFESV